jgi:hypothetical protein
MSKILTYTEFINEGRSELNESEWIKLFKEHCGLYRHNNKLLYRGTSNKGDYGLFTSDSNRKVSGGGIKWLTNLKGWEKYPKRDKSLIFTNSKESADEFSRDQGIVNGIYIVIPFDNVKIGVTSGRDFNIDSFKYYSFLSIETDFVWFIIRIMEFAYPDSTTPSVKNKIDLIKLENAMNKFFTTDSETIIPDFEELSYEILDIMDSDKITPWEAFSKILSPEFNNFKLVNYNGNNTIFGKEPHELWTEGNCLMIKKDKYNKLVTSGIIPIIKL